MRVVRAVIFHPGAREEIRALPKELRYRLGRTFRKKTEQTPQSEILLARRRLKEMLDGGT
jgi:hypothetical protein